MYQSNINNSKAEQALAKSNSSVPQQSKKRTKKNSLTSWSSRYNELKLYKLKYGNCNVSRHWPQNPSLGQWVQSQRNHYRYWKRGKGKTSMTQERFDALDSLGFKWVFQTHSASKAWSERLEELKNYAKAYGHCDTPHRWPQNPSLGQWVSTQRAEYAKWKLQKPSTMTEDRKNALEAIGFNWCLRKRPARKVWDKEGYRKKQKNSPSNLLLKRSTETIPDNVASQEPLECPILNTNGMLEATHFECHQENPFPIMSHTIGGIDDNSHSLSCYDTDIIFEYEPFLPELQLQRLDYSAFNVPDCSNEGISISPSHSSDVSDKELDFDELSQISFDEEFFQTLENFM